MEGLFQGFYYFFKGISIIHNNKLYKFLLKPCLINLLLGLFIIGTSFYFLHNYADTQFNSLYDRWISESYKPGIIVFFLNISSFLFSILLSVTFYVIIYSMLFSIIIIPALNSLVVELEKLYLGKEKNSGNISKEIIHSVAGVMDSVKASVIIFLAFIISILFGPLQPFFMAVVQGYFLGKDSFLYMIDKDARNLKHRRLLKEKFRAESLGLGVANFLFLFIPILGLWIAPAAAISGAFLIYHNKE